MAPKWPKKAIGAIAALFRTLQDVDVYVEDRGSEGFYTELLKVACAGSVRIARVLPLEGRKNVIDAARSHDFTKRAALFVVDGDFEWVRDEQPPQVPGIYRLDAYCVENLILCSHTATQYLMECEATDEATAREALNFEVWREAVAPLVRLFETWAALNTFTNQGATVGSGIGQFLATQPFTHLDQRKIEAAIQVASKKLAQQSGGSDLLARVRTRVSKLERPLDCISGKDFLLPALDFHVRLKTKEKSSRAALRFRLARHTPPERLAQLSGALMRAANSLNDHH